MSKFSDAIANAPRAERPKGPVWSGPESSAENGGITFSLLNRFLVCRERFRLLVVEGLKVADTFEPRLEYGNMWHVCEEAQAGCSPRFEGEPQSTLWEDHLHNYAVQLCERYPYSQEQIEHWYQFCKVQFPLYVEYWSKQKDQQRKVPLLTEQVFSVPYRLPSGRTVYLRGKWDSVHLIGGKIWLQENKTKSQIDNVKVMRQLRFDLQTMLYMVALQHEKMNVWDCEGFDRPQGQANRLIAGVLYNVVRRSAHKSVEAFTKKLMEDKANNRLGEWFGRFTVEVSQSDIERFRKECLDPILEQLCDWWDWIKVSTTDPFSSNDGCENSLDQSVKSSIHWRHPYGCYNILDEGGFADVDNYLESGTTGGLRRVTELFEELRDDGTSNANQRTVEEE